MGAEELLAALRCEGERKAEAIRSGAEEKARQLRGEAEEVLERTRRSCALASEAAVEALRRSHRAKAQRAARLVLLGAQDQLARRLWRLSLRLLATLRDPGYPALFAEQAEALPEREWEQVRVNPADPELARRHFPLARIEADPAVSGGLEALSRGGELRVVDTFEKRLERGWPELLPLILEEVNQCVTRRRS